MRFAFFVIVLAGLVSAQTVRAGLITDDLVFQNLTPDDGTVAGSFTYDDSGPGPYTVTSISLSDTFISGSIVTAANPGLTFDGTALAGPVSISEVVGYIPHEGDLIEGITGTLSDLSNSLSFSIGLTGYTFFTDPVTGPVTITPGTTAVPEPSTILMGAIAGAILGGLGLRRRVNAKT
jgi:hypothetical protein